MKTLFSNLTAALRGGFTLIGSLKLTLSLVSAVLITGLLSLQLPLLEWLCFDYNQIVEQQQYWRLITAHFIHSSASHLFWDISAFALLAGYLEYKSRRLLIYGLVFGVVIVSAYLLSPLAALAQYCGLSAVVYTLLIVSLWQWQQHAGMSLTILAISTVAIKSLLEQFNQTAVFVSSGWSVASDTHLIGILAGLLLLLALTTGNKKAAVKSCF